MARKAALVVRWTQPARGREAKALEGFMDFLTFWGKKAADGHVAEPESYFSYDGSHGFAVVKGPSDVIQQAIESEEYEKIVDKGTLTVDNLTQALYLTGDDEIQRGMRIFAEAASELGYM